METVEQLVSFHHIQVQLSGGAPWGFTLKGGLEHGEPLIITKIEDEGKAAHCKKLKVGDELININGSALYGSRQEALILIKGSFRILKLTVRSDLSMQWSQLSRPYSSTDRSSSLGSMESLDTPTPTTQPYSDSHNSPVDPTLFNNKRDSAYSSFSASSNTSDYATVPLRPGEANSMDNLLSCQGYPVRDTSTLCESPSEGKDEAPLITQKSRSLTRPRPRPIEVKERPSSCCYEQERRGGGFEILRNGETGMERKRNPPQPPTRKDSFRATRSRPNSTNPRCASAPIESSGVSSYYEENKLSLNLESGMHNGFPVPGEGGQSGNFEKDTLDTHCIQTEDIRRIKCDTSAHKDYNSESTSENLSEPLTASLMPNLPSDSDALPAEASTEVQEQSRISHTQTKHCSTVLHRHSAPEKLLATQLQLLQFNSDSPSVEPCSLSNPSEPSLSPCSSQWSPSSLQPMSEHQEASQNHLHATSNKWGGSRCSTPGSVFFEGDGDDKDSRERLNVNGSSLTPDQHHMPWGRSVSVPGESTGSSAQERLSSDLTLERDFEPLSAAASMDTLLDEQKVVDRGRGEEKKQEVVEGEASAKKSNSSRNHRRNRRRSERFATNLRNEIQRKKAQLQRSRGPGGLLCSRETVQEEDPDVNEEGDAEQPAQEEGAKATFATPSLPQDSQTSEPVIPSNTSSESDHDVLKTQSPSLTYPQNNSLSRSVQILDPGVPSFGVGIRVVEEPAPAGKARRWRWTPEHKLQPEPDQDRQCRVSSERVLGVTGSRHGVCAFTSSSTSAYGRSSSGSRTEDSDILPFADRMKFFEQTSKGVSVSNALGSIRSTRGGEPPNQRRYSYQGGQQESSLPSNTVEARRQSVSNSRERQKEKEREQAREREERLREREERLREKEKQQEKERQERELEMERARMREMEREREREERVRQWERERELELEREKEMERARERERLQNQREKELEKEREEDCQLTSHQEFYRSCGFTVKTQDFQQHKENFHNFQPKPQIFSHSQTHSHVPRSAFYPVSTPSQRPENRQALHPGFSAQSYTSAETYPARQQETSKLNRKYSLTERDYPSWRRESRPPENIGQYQQLLHQPRWGLTHTDSSTDDHNGYAFAPPPAPLYLRGRAMSENDLRFDSSQRWSPSISMATSQTLSEVEEGNMRRGDASSVSRQNRKKTPPPPRPPPPKWEQFHRRRASHHALFSSSSASAASHSIPPSFSSPGAHYSAHSSSYIPPPDTSRQRSFSLPPERQEVVEGGCPRCSCSQTQERTIALSNQNQPQFQERLITVAPPSPMFSRRGFRPVAPPHREREAESPLPPPPPPPPSVAKENSVSSSSATDVSCSPDHDKITVKPYKQQPGVRPGAEWERASSPRVHSNTANPPVLENRGVIEASDRYASQTDCEQLRADRGFQMEEQQKIIETGTESETTLSPSPEHSLEADLDIPLETDIDDFQEEELPGEDIPITSELPCFALPVTVLETDIDTLPDSEASPSRRTRAESSSLEEELEGGERSSREGLSLEELFPQSSEGESGTESWRGAQPAEHSTDSLDRRSGASSSCSSYYSTSTAKAQILSQMKDFADNRERDEDDELTYKKQLMESLRKKLGVLREAQRGLQEDIRANAQLGEEVESMVVSVCKPNEVDKFRMFIGDLDKVVSLLLSLSGRLLRVETTLDTLDPETEHHERLPLLEKKRQLMRQLSEAQDLKDHVDRREQAVSRVLARCLSPEQHRDYSHFVKMKAALLVEQRQLEDKIRLGEEQLRGLRESLGLGLGMGMGMSMGYGQY
ncbi:protein Shroom4 isoform X1 [Oreochromis niloticus]|uniref:Shroom family member 4 n=1 Tax=Oreochromis niloticus TaxID=8128 RepID=A0A669EF78_ORENI|nr:protein Shroom4 isoform X1 [Oreochromis niloticus]